MPVTGHQLLFVGLDPVLEATVEVAPAIRSTIFLYMRISAVHLHSFTAEFAGLCAMDHQPSENLTLTLLSLKFASADAQY
jgi:hypothetical protein